MPLPLLWIGAAAISALTVKSLSDDRKSQQRQRGRYRKVQTLSDLDRHESPIAIYPSDMMSTEQVVKPQVGAIVCCGIGGVLDHSGIWVDDNTIVELDGEGLIKPISVQRFTKERSGKQIFIACDSDAKPLACEMAAQRALNQLFQMRDYHVIDNNCHHFIWQCFEPHDKKISTFKELNINLSRKFDRKIYWDLCEG
ncbi:lecithin retinol acyltransferase family protein [Colwelliaceae bacterium 6441]